MSKITRAVGREILDSRGYPTVEVDVYLESGAIGRASVPAGTSTGTHEAIEKRDGDRSRYLGKGVREALKNVAMLGEVVKGHDACDQAGLDQLLIRTDGTPNKERCGANAILAISMAAAQAAARERNVPLFQHLGGSDANLLPIPMMNIINGGAHADSGLDIQEYMIVPHGLPTFSEALRAGIEVFHALNGLLKAAGLATSVGHEGGFAPQLASNEAPLELIIAAIRLAGYEPARHISLALDAAASHFYDSASKRYILRRDGRSLDTAGLVRYWKRLCKNYPIISIEDGITEDDWEGWKLLHDTMQQEFPGRVRIVGDDLLCTNLGLLETAIQKKAANAILVKLNQVGTVSETLSTVRRAAEAKWSWIVSHRSGETEDTFIAHLAVATGSGWIKTGSGCRSDRVAKYNELLRIEEMLGMNARFAGGDVPIGR